MKKLIVTLLSIACLNSVNAQKWGGGVDEQRYNFGFTFQYITSELKIRKTPDWRSPFFDEQEKKFVTDPLSAISSKPSPGFGVGLVFNYKVNSFTDLRFTPTLVFNDRLVQYQYDLPALNNKDFSFVEKSMESTIAEIPLTIKLKSERLKNFRAYLLLGGKYSVDISSKERTDDKERGQIFKFLKGTRNYFSYESGVGFDLYFHNFKLSPEFKLGYSFNNVIAQDKTPFSIPIEKAKLRQFTFSLFIE